MNTEKTPVPVSSDIAFIMGDSIRKLMIGWLRDLSAAINRPVSFYYRTDGGRFECIEDPLINESLFPLCRQYQLASHGEANCRSQYEALAKFSYDEFTKQAASKNTGKKVKHEKTSFGNGQEFTYDTYPCDYLGLIKWVVPVIIENVWYGVFITGNFGAKEEDRNTIKKTLAEKGLGALSDADLLDPPQGQAEEFFQQIQAFAVYLGGRIKARGNKEKQKLHEVFDEMQPYLHGQKYPLSLREGESNYDDQHITDLFRENRTNLFEALTLFRDVIGLSGLHVFKARSQIDAVIPDKDIPGCVLDGLDIKHTEDSILLDRTRQFPVCRYRLSREALEKFYERKSNNQAIRRAVVVNPKTIFDIVKKPAGELTEDYFVNAILIGHANPAYQEYPVVYILFFKDSEAKKKYTDIPGEFKILKNVSMIYLTKWHSIFALYQGYISKMITRFINHELGNALFTMRNELTLLYVQYQGVLSANKERYEDTLKLFNATDNILAFLDEYIPNSRKQYNTLGIIRDMTDSELLLKKPKLEAFAHDWLLFELVNNYKPSFTS